MVVYYRAGLFYVWAALCHAGSRRGVINRVSMTTDYSPTHRHENAPFVPIQKS